jgi:hypothetical protein
VKTLDPFREVWAVDFEFQADKGERPAPICMVARELRTGRVVRLFAEELEAMGRPPFGTGPDILFVAYYASAELGCFLALGWPMPARVLDLFVEFRCLTNGRTLPAGAGLLGALTYFGLDSMDGAEKEEMRALAMRGGPYTKAERVALLDYCQTDVDALAKLLPKMIDRIDLPRALLRGRYMASVARMEWAGTPIDTHTLARLRSHWGTIKAELIEAVDRDFGVYDGPTFKVDRFARWLASNGIPWPCLESGLLDLKEDTFRDMAKTHEAVAPLRELRHTLGELRLFDLAVGSDGRNRCLLSPFRSKTGRNQPSNSAYIFGPSRWLRGLIQPPAGRALAYIDYSQQEFGIAAALSNDPAMLDAYTSGDPYLRFAIQAGAAPPDATKATHGAIRDQFKTCALGVLYGLGEASLGQRIGKSSSHARELLRLHKAVYPRFWQWSQAAVDSAILFGSIGTVFGWTQYTAREINPRSLANFPMQGNGAEILRLACSMLTEAGVTVCAPVHDAVLIEASESEIDQAVEHAQAIMGEASRVVLGGFEIGTDAKIVRHPDRYMDARGRRMWETIGGIIDRLEGSNATIGEDSQA